MDVIQFKEANCRNCYKCLRSCPVKAISFNNNQAFVRTEECVLCANCIVNCPQDAKNVRSDIEIVQKFIEKKEKIYVSLAPSFVSAYDSVSLHNLKKAIMQLGIASVDETSKGATLVSQYYMQLIRENKMKNIITTACPSIVNLVRTHYPMLVDNLATCVSPMVAHGKMLKEIYGKRIKVVFIGPCISKKAEYAEADIKNFVDAVLTFDELEMLFEANGINVNDLNEADEMSDSNNIRKSKYYPAPGGIIKTLDPTLRRLYKFISVDGIERCIKILESLKNNNSQNYFIEMSSCEGSCLSGPGIRNFKVDYLRSRDNLLTYIRKSTNSSARGIEGESKVSLSRTFKETPQRNIIPSEEVIKGILENIGKYTKEQELNCGTCGYATCREKAIAVYNGKAYAYMCLPFIRDRAESMSNVIISKAPNAIIAMDLDLNIMEVNQAAIKLFKLSDIEVKGLNIMNLLGINEFITVKERKENIIESKLVFEKFNITVEGSILYLEQQNMIVAMLKDVTSEEKDREQLYKMRSEAVQITNQVIDKQMRVVQEIAGLLGETTAETKVALTRLKASMMDENG